MNAGVSVLFVFVDGVGLGDESDANPFFAASLPTMKNLLGSVPSLIHSRIERSGSLLLPLDAALGVAGLPQSGTGQATLLTGVNCARVNGAHFGPYPPLRVRSILLENNLFRRVATRGLLVDFANAYPQQYFDYFAARPVMQPAIASAYLSTGNALHTLADIEGGAALSADITGGRWSGMGHPEVPALAPREAGRRLASIARERAFTMFEYFMTDKAGHRKDMAEACAALETLDGLLAGMMDGFEGARMTLVITSDHGNMEDLSTGTHTRNPVPLLVAGDARGVFAGAVSLADVAPAIASVLAS